MEEIESCRLTQALQRPSKPKKAIYLSPCYAILTHSLEASYSIVLPICGEHIITGRFQARKSCTSQLLNHTQFIEYGYEKVYSLELHLSTYPHNPHQAII